MILVHEYAKETDRIDEKMQNLVYYTGDYQTRQEKWTIKKWHRNKFMQPSGYKKGETHQKNTSWRHISQDKF